MCRAVVRQKVYFKIIGDGGVAHNGGGMGLLGTRGSYVDLCARTFQSQTFADVASLILTTVPTAGLFARL